MIEIKKGMRIVFPEGNQVKYFGDRHTIEKGLPPDLVFKIESQAGSESFWISALGYGHDHLYGQGTIAVHADDIIPYLIDTQEPNDDTNYPVLSICKNTLEWLGFDKSSVSDEQFAILLKKLRDYYQDESDLNEKLIEIAEELGFKKLLQ